MYIRYLRHFIIPLLLLSGQELNAQGFYTPLVTGTGRTIDLSRPVGVIDGTGNATGSGGAAYTIPIKCPPGTHGLAPKIAVTYNSQSGNGLLGMGWNIAGLSSITRVAKDLYHDNTTGAVDYTANDRFALDGNRLNGGTGSYGAAGSTYQPEAADFSTVTFYDNVGNGPKWFRVGYGSLNVPPMRTESFGL